VASIADCADDANIKLNDLQALDLQEELVARYHCVEFRRKLDKIKGLRNTSKYAAAVNELCLPEQAVVLPRYGLQGNQAGVNCLNQALKLLELNRDVLAASNKVRTALGLPMRQPEMVQRIANNDRHDDGGMFDWGSLDVQEEEYFEQVPACFGYGGRIVRVLRRQLGDADPESTGQQIWPAAEALANYFEKDTRDAPADRNILELGAGMGLVGLAALALGAKKVVLTDVEDVLIGLRKSIRLNKWINEVDGNVDVAELDWRDAAAGGPLPKGPFDLICWADCVFWPELFRPLVATLERLATRETVIAFSVATRGVSFQFLELLNQSFRVLEVWRSRTQHDVKIFRARRL